MTLNGQGQSPDIFPHESESIPTVEEFGVLVKEITDKLARVGSVLEFVGPEPALGVSRQDIRRRIRSWLVNQRWVWWRILCDTQRHVRELISGPCLGAKTRFLSLNRIQSRAVTGLLTGHNTLFTVVRYKTGSKNVTDGSNFCGRHAANVARISVSKVYNYLDVRTDFCRHTVDKTIINRVQLSRIMPLRIHKCRTLTPLH
jgi:hypothetical protein